MECDQGLATGALIAASGSNGATVLRDAATLYKLDADAIALKVKQEFAAKDRAKKVNGTATAKLPGKAKESNRRKAA